MFPSSGLTIVFDNATSGKFENIPSGALDILFQSVASTMNFASGHGITSLSFDYSDTANSTYSPTVTACTVTGKEFCSWSLATTNFSGLAESVTFGGTGIGQVEFDSGQMNMTAVPISAALPLLLLGVAGLGTWVRRRNRYTNTALKY
jgi:hypothetical protein